MPPNSIMKPQDFVGLTEAFFLLFLAVAGNFIAETLGCETQYYLSHNIYLKQLVLLMMIYFTTNFTAAGVTSPSDTLKKTFWLWGIFLLFTKMPPFHTIIVIILAIIIYIINNYKKFLSTQKEKKDAELVELEKYENILVILTGIVLLLGFVTYYKAKRREYKHHFVFSRFLFGVEQCHSMR